MWRKLILTAKFFLILIANPVNSAEIKDALQTLAGPVKILHRDLFDDVLLLNGKEIKTESGKDLPKGAFDFEAILPSRVAPNYAVITYNSGGNACGVWGIYILQLVGQPWLSDDLGVCNVDSVKATLKRATLSIEMTSYDEANDLGGSEQVTWKYSGNVLRIQPKLHSPNYWRHEGMHPFQFLGVASIRGPILDALGDKFRDMRERLAVSSNMATVNYRYLVGQGCMAHACGSDEAFLIVDGYNGDTWAFYTKDGKEMLTFGAKSTFAHVPRLDLLSEWLTNWNVELATDTLPIRIRTRTQR